MQDQAYLRVKDCIGFGSWSAAHCVAGGGKPNGCIIVYIVWQEAVSFCVWVVIRKEVKWYDGSWLGGFEWVLFVGVDAFA